MNEIRDRLFDITSDWDIVAAILDEFLVYQKYEPDIVDYEILPENIWSHLPDDPFDIAEWLGLANWNAWNCRLPAMFEASGAETEQDYYTDPAPYDGPNIMWSNPHYVCEAIYSDTALSALLFSQRNHIK